MSAPVRRQYDLTMPRLWEWLDSGLFGGHGLDLERVVRVEELVKDGRYVVRAQLPGIDPEKDVEVTVGDGVLRIHGERHEEHTEGRRTEFTYGAFSRAVALPAGADEDDVTATYTDGILEVSVGMGEVKPEVRTVTVTKGA